MAKKKDKAKTTKGKRIKVAKVKRKKPRQSKKKKRRTRGRRGQGQYSDFFPTNRQIDSNQYWQLRAEIAGAEARVRASLQDRKSEESKAEQKVDEIKRQVEVLANTPLVQQQTPNVNFNPTVNVGTPVGQSPAQNAVAGGEYNGPEYASAQRDGVSDEHQVDLTAETPTKTQLEPEPEPIIEHRGETFEDQEQRKRQQLRDALKHRQQSKMRQLANIVGRWKTVSDTAIAKSKLQQENEPGTPHNIHKTSSEASTPTRDTVQSVVETGAPPASAAKTQDAKKSKRRFLLSEQTVSPKRGGGTTPESVIKFAGDRRRTTSAQEAVDARNALEAAGYLEAAGARDV